MSASDPTPNRPVAWDRPVVRFLALGGANTAVTAVAFYLLSFVMEPRIAFTIVYFCGLAFVTFVTPRFVFDTRPRHRRRAAMAGWYLVVYLCGLAATSLLDRTLDLPRP